MAWTAPKDFSGGSQLTAAELDTYVSDNTTWLKAALTAHGITSDSTPQAVKSARYGVSVTATSANVNDASDVAVSFSTEEYDDAGFHSTVTNTQRITIPSGGDGTYTFIGWVGFASDDDGRREVWFEKNLATEYNRIRVPSVASAATGILVTCDLVLVAGDFVILRARQNSGATLSVDARFQARRVAV